jgi:endoglucanase
MKLGRWSIAAAWCAALAVPILVYCVPSASEPAASNTPAAVSAAQSIKRREQVRFSRYLVVDQFGYTPTMTKIAILANPERGWNQGDRYDPGPNLEVRDAVSGEVAFQGASNLWNGGAVDESSGDRGKWFDFSSLRKPGRYFVYDPQNDVRSDEFAIAADVYAPILKAALRVFYFNRANFAKTAPHACVGERCWLQGVDYVGPGQDRAARSVLAKDDPGTERDLSGGFWDAGDVNKYVTFTYSVLHQLLAAYDENPRAFGDDLNIPESGNGIPDVLDLVQVELDFLKRMQAQDLDGGVLPKVGNIEYGDPEPAESKQKRYYYPASCSSAVVTVSSVFAHAATVFSKVPKLAPGAADLVTRAESAFSHYQTHPRSDACDDGTIHSGDSDISLPDQDLRALSASIYLWETTGKDVYSTTIANSWNNTRLMKEDRLAAYDAPIANALLHYATKIKGATPAVSQAIVARTRALTKNSDVTTFAPERSLYRTHMRKDSYHWGSNQIRANFGTSALLAVTFGLAPAEEATQLKSRAADLLHYFHGKNALGLVMLSNMKSYGAERSVNEIYHTWFHDGNTLYDSALTSKLGPAPGYLVGGVNPSYCASESDHRCFVSEFKNQPIEKAYVDFNTAWEPPAEFDMSWALSEPAIYYQAAYIQLLSKFAPEAPAQ